MSPEPTEDTETSVDTSHGVHPSPGYEEWTRSLPINSLGYSALGGNQLGDPANGLRQLDSQLHQA